jgi:hypothetical protein
VTTGVVDLLEPVEVADGDGHGRASRLRGLDPLVERAPVPQSGEVVGVCERADVGEQLRAVDRGADLARVRLQERNDRALSVTPSSAAKTSSRPQIRPSTTIGTPTQIAMPSSTRRLRSLSGTW